VVPSTNPRIIIALLLILSRRLKILARMAREYLFEY
jgi:hypothetical protein